MYEVLDTVRLKYNNKQYTNVKGSSSEFQMCSTVEVEEWQRKTQRFKSTATNLYVVIK